MTDVAVRARRVAAAVVAMALMTVSLATRASAVTPARCTSLAAPPPVVVGAVFTRTATLAGCNPRSATGGSGQTITNLNTFVGKTTWAGGAGTTTVSVIYKAGPKPDKCPTGTHLTVSVEKVIGGSGAALAAIKVGYVAAARLCVTPEFAVSLEPGSAYEFKAAVPVPTTTTSVPSANSPPPPLPLPHGLSACPADTNRSLVALVNHDRKKTGGLPPLVESPNLDWAARKHSIAMATTLGVSHVGWDTEIAESHFVVGAPYWTAQNIAIGPFYTLPLVESGFFDEHPPHDGHRLNILGTGFHKIGIGCVIKNSTRAYAWTQDFGS